MSQRAKQNKSTSYKLSKETRRLVSYWRQSLVDGSRVSISTTEANSESKQISFDEFTGANCNPDIFFSLVGENTSGEIDVLVSPIKLRKQGEASGPKTIEPLWIPAILTSEGNLLPATRAIPWTSRNYLEPLPSDSLLAISSVKRVDRFLKQYPTGSSRSWVKYLEYCEKFFESATGERIVTFAVEGYKREQSVSLVLDGTAGSGLAPLIRIYQELLDGKRPAAALKFFTSLKQKKRQLLVKSSSKAFSLSKKHLGQFSNQFALSVSQREAIHSFFAAKESDLVCVTGPPGTGKTTLLQSVIASLWVESIFKSEMPPVIVASSETNQAVTNIINSFERSSTEGSVFSRRWLPEVSSYGSFCCSESKASEMGRYQLELKKGKSFSDCLNDQVYLERAEKYFKECFYKATGKKKSLEGIARVLKKQLKKERVKLRSEIGGGYFSSLFEFFGLKKRGLYSEAISKLEGFDTSLRYKLFLLATHYWEARSLLRAKEQIAAPSFKKGYLASREDWQLRAMLTPVFVSTLTTLPRFFSAKRKEAEPLIDLLIFDEAGQISPEIAAASCALAKKVLVVGDTLQLEPVWRVTNQIDISNLQQNKLLRIGDEKQFRLLERKGVLASASNFMQLALRSSNYQSDDQTIGVFLREHRRSVPEIVSFCNRLAYLGRLSSKRSRLEERVLPAFMQIDLKGESKKRGPSRENQTEAEKIVSWIAENKEKLEQFYAKPIQEIVAVLTPFSAQNNLLKKKLRANYPKLQIGTVNSMQGAEAEVVLFSSVYDSSYQGRYFFDQKPNFLNVAVSRAKDSFIVFGDAELFRKYPERPSGVLGEFIFR